MSGSLACVCGCVELASTLRAPDSSNASVIRSARSWELARGSVGAFAPFPVGTAPACGTASELVALMATGAIRAASRAHRLDSGMRGANKALGTAP